MNLNLVGMTSPAGLCSSGYFCIEGSRRSDQEVCPAGYYCGEGTHTPDSCPPGTYSNVEALERVDQCTECTPGWFCDERNFTAPVAECQEGKNYKKFNNLP